ncbi:MAG: HAD-IA family hydrolase [Solirubrobacteraceae bacterium]|nr:HAD-IA family hydrolase [Solirubrobacteraceae bacterium]
MRRCVTLDALGTLVELDDPFARLHEELTERGAPVTPEQAEHALRAEMSYYRAHHDEAVDEVALADLRAACVGVLADALPRTGLDAAALLDALLAALRFVALPGARDALLAWQEEGVARVVVSNWDVSLHAVLRETGLAPLLDAVVTSAEAGVAKPDPAIFAGALALVGCAPEDAVHVGDSVEHDVAGALAAGMGVVLVTGGAPAPDVPAGTLLVDGIGVLAEPRTALPYPGTQR